MRKRRSATLSGDCRRPRVSSGEIPRLPVLGVLLVSRAGLAADNVRRSHLHDGLHMELVVDLRTIGKASRESRFGASVCACVARTMWRSGRLRSTKSQPLSSSCKTSPVAPGGGFSITRGGTDFAALLRRLPSEVRASRDTSRHRLDRPSMPSTNASADIFEACVRLHSASWGGALGVGDKSL